MQSKLRRRIATSPIARGAALPLRTMAVARYDARLIGRSLDWLARILGNLIHDRWARVLDRRIGSSVTELAAMRDGGLFLHDSLHTYDYEARELAAVAPNLRPDAIILSDNAHDSAALSDWAERTGRH